MSTKRYSMSQRGGGKGDTGRMRAAILQSINSWWAQADWVDPEKAERLNEKLNEAPERFISPNPDADYQEEASRIYGEIKDEFALKTAGDLDTQLRDWDDRAQRHLERKRREKGFSAFESGSSDDQTIRFETVDVELVNRPRPSTADTTQFDRPAEPESPDQIEPSEMGIVRLMLTAFVAIALSPFSSAEPAEPAETNSQQKITSYQ